MLAVSETEARRGAAYGDHEVDAAFREEGVQVASERIFGVRLGKPRRLDRRLEELDRSRRKLRQLSAKPGANSSKGAKFGPNEYRMSARLWGVSWAISRCWREGKHARKTQANRIKILLRRRASSRALAGPAARVDIIPMRLTIPVLQRESESFLATLLAQPDRVQAAQTQHHLTTSGVTAARPPRRR